MEDANNALKRNGDMLGIRKVDIKSIPRQRVDSILNSFKHSEEQEELQKRRTFNNDRDRDGDRNNSDRETDLFLSNVPYRATVDDILSEFRSFDLDPSRVEFILRNGQPTGTVRLSFNSHEDAAEVMERKNMCKLMNRTIYIKFFRQPNYNRNY